MGKPDPTGTAELQGPLDRLAQAVLDGRVYLSTEWWEDRDGVKHTTTTINVEADRD